MENGYQKLLEQKTNAFAHMCYKISKSFSKSEIFGITSQLSRASLSVALNIVEGYARNGKNEFKHFLNISYGSLKESIFILRFSNEKVFVQDQKAYKECLIAGEEIGAMIWGILCKLK